MQIFFINNEKDESLRRAIHALRCQSAGSRGQPHRAGRAGVTMEEMELPDDRIGTRSQGSKFLALPEVKLEQSSSSS